MNTGDKLLTNCEAKAEIKPENGQMKEDAAVLHWARRIITTKPRDESYSLIYGKEKPSSLDLKLIPPSYENPFGPITINRGDTEFLDILKSFDEYFTLFSDRHFRNIGTNYSNGEYKLKITIFSPGLTQPARTELKIVKSTGWNSIEIIQLITEKKSIIERLRELPIKFKFLIGFITITSGILLEYLRNLKKKRKKH